MYLHRRELFVKFCYPAGFRTISLSTIAANSYIPTANCAYFPLTRPLVHLKAMWARMPIVLVATLGLFPPYVFFAEEFV